MLVYILDNAREGSFEDGDAQYFGALIWSDLLHFRYVLVIGNNKHAMKALESLQVAAETAIKALGKHFTGFDYHRAVECFA